MPEARDQLEVLVGEIGLDRRQLAAADRVDVAVGVHQPFEQCAPLLNRALQVRRRDVLVAEQPEVPQLAVERVVARELAGARVSRVAGAPDAVGERRRGGPHRVAGALKLLEDRRVDRGDLGLGARSVAQPDAEHVRVDRLVLRRVVDRRRLGDMERVLMLGDMEAVLHLARGQHPGLAALAVVLRLDRPLVVDVADEAGAVREADLTALAPGHDLGRIDDRGRQAALVEDEIADLELVHQLPARRRRDRRVERQRLAFDARDDVVGQLDPLERAAEDELAGVDDELVARLDHDLLGEVGRRLAQVDRGRAVVVEDAEGVAEAQVDGRGLDVLGIPRRDRDPALLDQAQDRSVGQHRLGSAVRHGRKSAMGCCRDGR